MKLIYVILFLCSNVILLAQNQRAQGRIFSLLQIQSGKLWDYENSTNKFKIDSVGFGQIPHYVEYRGALVEAVKWIDANGENLVLLTRTGLYQYDSNAIGTLGSGAKADLYVHWYVRKSANEKYTRRWRMNDEDECGGLDNFVGFYDRSLTITDLNNDSLAEVTVVYQMYCKGGLAPSTQKVILYDLNKMYGIRGKTAFCNKGKIRTNGGGEYEMDEDLKSKNEYRDFMITRWYNWVCEYNF